MLCGLLLELKRGLTPSVLPTPFLRTLKFARPQAGFLATRLRLLAPIIPAECDGHAVTDHVLIEIALAGATARQQTIEAIPLHNRTIDVVVTNQAGEMALGIATATPRLAGPLTGLFALRGVNPQEANAVLPNDEAVTVSSLSRPGDRPWCTGPVNI